MLRPLRAMPYSTNTIYTVKKVKKPSQGNILGRLAVDLDFSVSRISKATGASRQTVYNWMNGNEVLTPYRPTVEKLINILQTATTADEAWRTVCQEFNLQA